MDEVRLETKRRRRVKTAILIICAAAFIVAIALARRVLYRARVGRLQTDLSETLWQLIGPRPFGLYGKGRKVQIHHLLENGRKGALIGTARYKTLDLLFGRLPKVRFVNTHDGRWYA